jgi:predicted  nucleic acid-binding Zn-ribbon protein
MATTAVANDHHSPIGPIGATHRRSFVMLKKGIIAGAAAMLLATFFFGRDAWSYVSTSAGWVKDSVRDSVPIEFEIERARKLVKDLVPDIRANMHVIAKEEVEVARLEKQIGDAEVRLANERSGLMRLRNDLSSGKDEFQYAGRSFTANQVKLDLANRFERYKTSDATLASLRDIHIARQRSLDAARAKLEGMLASKRQLEVDVENLEARLKMVEAAQTTAEYNFDDSRLSRAKQLIGDLRTRLEVSERMVNSEGAFQDGIPLEAPQAENIVDEVTQYFELGVPAGNVAETQSGELSF